MTTEGLTYRPPTGTELVAELVAADPERCVTWDEYEVRKRWGAGPGGDR